MTSTRIHRKRLTVFSAFRPLFRPWGLWRVWGEALRSAGAAKRSGVLMLGALMFLADALRYVFSLSLLAISLVVGLLAGVVMIIGLIIATLFGAGVGMAFSRPSDPYCSNGAPDLWR